MGGNRDFSCSAEPEGDYNASYNAFRQAVELMHKHGLREEFTARCEKLFTYHNLDLYYIEWLWECFAEGG